MNDKLIIEKLKELVYAYKVSNWPLASKLESELSLLQNEGKEELDNNHEIIKGLSELKSQLKGDGYRDWCYSVIAIDGAINLLKRLNNCERCGNKSEKMNIICDNCIKEYIDHSASPTMSNWIALKDQVPPIGIEYLGFSPKWIDEDYNPEGVRIWFHDDLGWYSAKYNNEYDCWDTTEEEIPTHWMPLPKAPNSKSEE